MPRIEAPVGGSGRRIGRVGACGRLISNARTERLRIDRIRVLQGCDVDCGFLHRGFRPRRSGGPRSAETGWDGPSGIARGSRPRPEYGREPLSCWSGHRLRAQVLLCSNPRRGRVLSGRDDLRHARPVPTPRTRWTNSPATTALPLRERGHPPIRSECGTASKAIDRGVDL
jgi:hypothetical protein